jgi:hypothetical protein
MSESVDPTITLTEDGDWWIARDTETGVVSQGETHEEALANLDEALEVPQRRTGIHRRGTPRGRYRPGTKRVG